MKQKIIIVAEAGVNHNGDLALARRLVEVAADAGADYVKFQTFNPELVITSTAKQCEYQISNTGITESQLDMVSRLKLSEADHYDLLNHAKKNNIKFFSTPFDLPSIEFLSKLELDMFKIPSGEITNLPYLRLVGRLNKPIVLSTGMSTLGDIENALKVLEENGASRSKVTLLHCTTEYPTPYMDVNLMAMKTLQQAFGTNVGYSDHTLGIEVSVAAAALGATLIEKHFTIDRTLPGPDHIASLEPDELKRMVSSIRNVELALGDGIKRVVASELKNVGIARKSLVANCAIKKGELFTVTNIAIKRPGTGISPMRYDEVIGKVASRDFEFDDLIEL